MVSPIRVKDGESAMNDESIRDIELMLITPNPTRLQTHTTVIGLIVSIRNNKNIQKFLPNKKVNVSIPTSLPP